MINIPKVSSQCKNVNKSLGLQWLDSVDLLKQWYTRWQILLGYVASEKEMETV